jgi:hypothetical protein
MENFPPHLTSLITPTITTSFFVQQFRCAVTLYISISNQRNFDTVLYLTQCILIYWLMPLCRRAGMDSQEGDSSIFQNPA